MRPGSNMGRAPLGVLFEEHAEFDWGDDRVRFHEHDLVIYEMHVRGFTRNPNSGVTPGRAGTFLGVVDKIPHLQELGITAVELLPVHQFDPQENNYWGYMTLNFFAPHTEYAVDQDRAFDEFRTMVKALHAAGIEVLLDVVFNHTAEGDDSGPCYSFKGIDNSTYYLTSTDPANPYGAQLPWPERPGARPARAAGAQVILIGGRAAAWISPAAKRVLTFLDADAPPDEWRLLAEALSDLPDRRGRGALLLTSVDGETPDASPLADPLRTAGFTPTTRGWLKRRG